MTAALILFGVWAASFAVVDRRVRRLPATRASSPGFGPLGLSGSDPIVAMVIAATAAVMISPVAGVGWLIFAPVHRWRDERRAAQQRSRAIEAELPFVAELFLVALRSGSNVTSAARQVARFGTGPVSIALADALAATQRGMLFHDALDDMRQSLGAAAEPLLAALIASQRWGVAVVDDLADLSSDLRQRHRRRAETDARRLPVLLLFPLVVCVLPAFGLLTVVPIMVDALDDFGW